MGFETTRSIEALAAAFDLTDEVPLPTSFMSKKAYLCETSSGLQWQRCYLFCVSRPLQCQRVHRVLREHREATVWTARAK